MLAAGIGLITLGYALLWAGVQRFRGDNVTLLEALGLGEAGQSNQVSQPLGAPGASAASSGVQNTSLPNAPTPSQPSPTAPAPNDNSGAVGPF